MNLSPDPPEDLDGFWSELVSEGFAAPLDMTRAIEREWESPTHEVETLTFRGARGESLHGWIAYPPGARRAPAFLWIPPYGRESVMPDQYGTREGYASLSFNFHGETAFHREKYVPSRGYFADGAADPERWIFRRMAQNAIIALRLLRSQIEVDEERIGAAGMSQGGGMAIWLGAYVPIVRAVCADMPFLIGTPWMFSRPVYRYPLKELADFMEKIPVGKEVVLNTLAYYDTLNVAPRCLVPTRLSLGLKDPSVRPEQVRGLYPYLQCEKQIAEYDCGHDWHPDMVEANRAWFERHLS